MRVAMVEDSAADRRQLTAWLDRYGRERHVPALVDAYASAVDAGLVSTSGGQVALVCADAQIRQRFCRYDLILLDMVLSEESCGHGQEQTRDHDGDVRCDDAGVRPDALMVTGLDVARALRAAGVSCPVIFETASVDYAVDGYEVASGYLVKPFDYERLAATIDRLVDVQPAMVEIPSQARDDDSGASSADTGEDDQMVSEPAEPAEGRGKRLQLRADAVLAVEVKGHYLHIALTGGRTVRMRATMAAAERALAGDARFHRCSRAVIVNLDHVERLNRDVFTMDDGSEVRISRRNITAARDAWYSRRLSGLNTQV